MLSCSIPSDYHIIFSQLLHLICLNASSKMAGGGGEGGFSTECNFERAYDPMCLLTGGNVHGVVGEPGNVR